MKNSKPTGQLPTINRGVIVVVPKQAFYDWVSKIDKEMTNGPEIYEDQSSYLIPDDFISDDIEEILKKFYKRIFEEELYSMFTDESLWPAKRTWDVFCKWFDCHVSSMVFDLCDDDIYLEED